MAKDSAQTLFVRAEELLSFLEDIGSCDKTMCRRVLNPCKSRPYFKQADICENIGLLEMLEAFRGSDCSEAVKTDLMNMLSELQSAAFVVEDELQSMEVLLKMTQRNSSCLLGQFFAAHPLDTDLPAIQEKLRSCNRILSAIKRASSCLEKRIW